MAYSRYATPSTARGSASSRRVTMSSVTRSRIWRAGHSPPLTYATTPSIYQGCAVTRSKAQPAGPSENTKQGDYQPEATEQKGDLLIRDLCANGTDSVHNMCVVNTDAKTYWEKTLERCLEEAERGKKKMYLEACLQQC